MRNFFILLFSIFIIFSCSKKEPEALSTPSNQDEAIKIYREGLKDLEDGQFFLARKKRPFTGRFSGLEKPLAS